MAKKRKTELDIETGAIPAPPPPPESAAPVSLEQEMAQDVASSQPPRQPINKNAIIVAGVVLAIVLAIIIAVTVIQKKKPHAAAKKGDAHGEKAKGAEAEKKKAEEVKFEKLNNLVLEPFVVPYKDKGQDGFVQIVFALQVDDPEVIDEINNNLPLIRNSILFAITTRGHADLIDPAKREALMKDIRFNVDRSLQNGRVEAVLLNAINVY